MHDTVMSAAAPRHRRATCPAVPGLGLAFEALSFEAPLARTAVHKAADAEVLLTDARPLGDDRFALAALWPRDHFLRHRGAGTSSDPFLLVETVRQATIHLSHRFYDVPEGHPFVLCDLDFDLERSLPPRGDSPLPVVLDAVCLRTTDNPRRFGMRLEVTAYADNLRIGRASLHWEAMEPSRYERVRFRNSPTGKASWGSEQVAARDVTPLPPMAVGHHSDSDVLLGWDPEGSGWAPDGSRAPGSSRGPDGSRGPGFSWRLRMDRDHPVLFDHQSDHIPGMVLLEAFRQAALAAAPRGTDPAPRLWSLATLSATFTAFGELDLPVVLRARAAARGGADDSPGVEVTAVQEGRTLASAVLRGRLTRPAHQSFEDVAAC
ncbi:ScbA/BarX family gamma-butyrolactone biosynthesis protein [Streptomyces sp. NPDC054863]